MHAPQLPNGNARNTSIHSTRRDLSRKLSAHVLFSTDFDGQSLCTNEPFAYGCVRPTCLYCSGLRLLPDLNIVSGASKLRGEPTVPEPVIL